MPSSSLDASAAAGIGFLTRAASWRDLGCRFARTRGTGVLLLIGLFALWEASAALGWVKSENWPPLTDVLRAVVVGVVQGELGPALASTLSRMAAGFALGTCIAVVLGVVLGRVRLLDEALRPVIEIQRTLPPPAIVPPLILLLGVDEALKVTVVAMAAFAPVFVNTYAGIRGADETLYLTARTFGLGRLATIWKVVLPSSVPFISAGMRTALSLSLIVAVIAEMISGASGVGYYLMSMQFAMRAADMYAAVICLAVVGYALNAAFRAVERRALRWYARTEI
jgi:ABC-type nitrate/sulfonate/bicarbonate transport system permease component